MRIHSWDIWREVDICVICLTGVACNISDAYSCIMKANVLLVVKEYGHLSTKLRILETSVFKFTSLKPIHCFTGLRTAFSDNLGNKAN